MFSFVLTLKSNIDVLEANFADNHNLHYYSAYDSADFTIGILSNSTIAEQERDIFYQYNNKCFVGLIGIIFNRTEIITIAQTLDPYAVTYTDSQLFYALFQQFGTDAISLIDGRFAILFIKPQAITLYSNSNATYPLYYYHEGHNFWLSNEVKFLSRLKVIDSSLVPLSNIDFKSYHSNDFTIFKYIKKIPLLHRFECKLNGPQSVNLECSTYKHNQEASVEIFQPNRVLPCIDYILRNSISNVLENLYDTKSVGIALSGGVDSSMIAAYITECNPELDLHCFTTGTSEANEFYDAKLCAEFLGAEHHEIIMNEKLFVDSLMNLVYHNEVFDTFAIEAYVSLDAIYAECMKYSNILFTGINADNIFSSSYELGTSPITEVQAPFVNLSRMHWNGTLASYNASMRNIIEYSPYASTKMISLVNILAARVKTQNSTDKYLLKTLAKNKNFLPMHNIFRKKVRYDKGSAVDLIFAKFLNIEPEQYYKKHLYIYKLFQLFFEEKVNFGDVDPYGVRDKLND